MKQIHKEYQRPFLLEPTKLTRLVDKIHERLGEHQCAIMRDHFEVFLSGNRREEMSNVDDVLALENSSKHKIQRLLLTCSAATERVARPEHEIQVDFATNKTSSASNPANTKVVAISIRSDIAGWATRTLSEVEEQVERTLVHYTQPLVVALIVLAVCAPILFASQFFSLRFGPGPIDMAGAMWLRGPDFDRIEQILRQSPVLTDDDMREVVTMQLRNLLKEKRPKEPAQKRRTRQLVFLGTPFIVVLGSISILILYCYPNAVFLWGDEIQRYARKVQTRNVLWTVIVGGMVIGVLSTMVFEGMVSLLPPE